MNDSLTGITIALAVDKVESVQTKLPPKLFRICAGKTAIRLHDPDPKVSVLTKKSKCNKVFTPQVALVAVTIPNISLLNVHQGKNFDAVVQLKITGSSISERANAFEGLVVMPPVTTSEKISTLVDALIRFNLNQDWNNFKLPESYFHDALYA